jgi:hypothetical protein
VYEEADAEVDDDVYEEADAGWDFIICGVDVSGEFDWNIWDEGEVIESAKEVDECWWWVGSGSVSVVAWLYKKQSSSEISMT